MALDWDLKKVNPPEDYQIWIKNTTPNHPESEAEVMNAITEILIFCTMFIGMIKIPKPNHIDFHHRITQWEMVMGGKAGLLILPETGDSRMPSLEEVKWHIGLETNADTFTKRQWATQLIKLMDNTIGQRKIHTKKKESNAEESTGVT